MRVVFLTILLGLVAGPHTLELAVEGSPAAIEILFDGVPVARVIHPPWVAHVDFGEDPMPREVVARAVDENGRELARAVQRVNLPHDDPSLEIVVERDDRGRETAARLVWQSTDLKQPRAFSLKLDGRPLPLVDRRAALPRLAPDVVHLLEASATSEVGRRSAALVIGGAFGERVATELVGVPLRTAGRRLAAAAASCLTGPGGEPVATHGLEAGGAEVFLVASDESRYALRRAMTPSFPSGRAGAGAAAPILRQPLPKLSRATFFWPELVAEARQLGDGRRADVFHHSPAMELSTGGFWERIYTEEPAAAVRRIAPRTADATGVAVLAAAGTGRRRAVIVVVGDREADASQYGPEQIRRLARGLHVPLHVWTVSDTPAPGWGPTRAVTNSVRELREAHWALRADLDQQTIAWVEGTTPLHRYSMRPDCTSGALAQ